jgi:hypothetical protein
VTSGLVLAHPLRNPREDAAEGSAWPSRRCRLASPAGSTVPRVRGAGPSLRQAIRNHPVLLQAADIAYSAALIHCPYWRPYWAGVIKLLQAIDILHNLTSLQRRCADCNLLVHNPLKSFIVQ